MRNLFLILLAGGLLGGCSTPPPMNLLLLSKGEATAMKEVMDRKDKIILVSSLEMDPRKPGLLLLHGATDDPTEMMRIVEAWSGEYNVLLYAYNYHQPIRKIALDLAGEIRTLKASNKRLAPRPGPMANLTVVTFSYSAAVFRDAVLLADDRALFSGVSLIQLVPTAGGSYLARGMGGGGVAWLVSLASPSCAAENPRGPIVAELWGDEGCRKFSEAIHPECIHTILIEGDRHSVANLREQEIQKRYQNGIGPNVVVIPRSAGVTHEDFPNHPLTLAYLKKLLEVNPEVAAAVDVVNGGGDLNPQ